MTEFDQEDVKAKNDESLRMLARSLTLSQGQFSLILARCNYRSLQQRLMQHLRERCPVEFRERVLDPSAKTIETTIQDELGDEPPPALIICGLESVRDLDAVLLATNQARDEFRKNFPFPLVLWGTDEVLRRLIRVAPDFESWAATPIEFEIATDELIHFIQETADEVFAKVLDTGAGIFLDNAALNLGTGSPLRAELESARHELQSRDVKLDPELEASLEFVLGRDADASVEQSRQHYERSLALWQNSPNLERRGCVLYSLGVWWRSYATRHRAECEQASGQAKDYYQQCVEVFEQANRKDLLAKFINALGVTLQQLRQWDELEVVAKKALTLHQTYPDPFRLARSYGLLAEVALAKSAWTEAKQLAEQALSILASAELSSSNSVSFEQSANLEWVRSHHQGWYLLSLARALSSLGQPQEAISTLETAVVETKPYYDPELYIRILEEMRSLYFKQGGYLKAFELRQERRSIEQQYGFRAFVGAGRLQPKQQVINPALAPVEAQRTPTQEITVSGRQQDVNRLVERIGRNDHKLTVIRGQSGVGKSSILQAGLIPVLKQTAINTRNVLPVLQQVYPDWIRVLGQCLAEALTESRNLPSSPLTLDSTVTILDQLRNSVENNLLIVLIFDQFEEFFFVYKEPSQRRSFYELLRDCLDIPYVKVILSLREDYIYYLLECNNRIISLDVINNNILDKNILYYLGNFSVDDAKSVIQSLTEQTHFSLELSLIDALVQDLAGESGEVRPIELQVVGAQLQTEKITKLEQYREHGPKAALVQRYLKEVVEACGSENKKAAELLLYLLTDENNTRPLKTRADLEKNLAAEAEKLDLVLEIFVASGLVFLLRETPAARYQLVHDYLVSFIRQQQYGELQSKLKELEKSRKISEQKFNRFLKGSLAGSFVAVMIIGTLTASAISLVLQAKNNEIAVLNNSSKWLYISNKELLDPLVEALKAGIKLKQAIWIKSETRSQALTALQQALSGVRERNRLQGHDAEVNSVVFSRDGQFLATASDDWTVVLWRRDGSKVKLLRKHQGAVNSVVFSPDGQTIASASNDKTVILWNNLDGKARQTLQGYSAAVKRVVFSPDGQMIASASTDGRVKLWSRDGTKIKTFQAHQFPINSIVFSPDGKTMATASKETKLWSRDGRFIKTLNGHSDWVNSVTFSPDGKTIATASADKTVKLWSRDGTFIRTFQGHQDAVNSVSFSPDSKFLASASKEVILWSVEGQELATLQGYNDWVNSISFSRDGQLLATASGDWTVRLWSLSPRRQNFSAHNVAINSISFSPDGQMIATASGDKTVQLWNRDRKSLHTLRGHHDMVTSVRFSPDGTMIATASADKTVKLWSRDGKLFNTLREHNDWVCGVSFSPDSQIIASASFDQTIKLWSRDGKPLNTLRGHKDWVKSVSFSPDGQTIASASKDKTVKLWSKDGQQLKTLTGFEAVVNSVSFSPDGTMIAAASGDKTIKLWNKDGQELKTLLGHQAPVESVVFSPDSQMIASASKDKTIKLWSKDGQELKTLPGYQAAVLSLSFSPEDKTLASADASGKITLWDLKELELDLDTGLKRACEWVKNYLKTNPIVEKSDRHLCDNIPTYK